MPRDTCRGTKDDGNPCGSPVLGPDGYCPAHRPEGGQDMRELGRRGGEATAKKLRRKGLEEGELPALESPRDAATALELIVAAVSTGRLGHREARAAVRGLREWLRAFDAGEMEERVEELEQKIAAFRRGELEVME